MHHADRGTNSLTCRYLGLDIVSLEDVTSYKGKVYIIDASMRERYVHYVYNKFYTYSYVHYHA